MDEPKTTKKSNHHFKPGPLPTPPKNFIIICSLLFELCIRCKWTDKQRELPWQNRLNNRGLSRASAGVERWCCYTLIAEAPAAAVAVPVN